MAVALVVIEKPALAEGPILASSPANYIGPTTNDTFVIKLITYDIRSRVPMEETSGDGDDGPTFDYVPWIYVSVVIDGIMVAANATGIDDLNGQTLSTDVIMKLGPTQTITLPGVVIHSINISATRRGLFNRVQMAMESTGQVAITAFENN